MIEENYPLSPIQQGMLFHSLYEQSSGVYIEQVICSWHENVNVSNFIQSWQLVVERHSILRTAFDWDDSHNLQQSVYKQIKLPIEQQDWQKLSLSQQSSQLNSYLQSDRQKGFNIAEVPLMRLALFQLAETDYKLVWTFHHALLDGRSIVIILKEVFSFYEALGQNQELKLEPAHPYGNYIDWLGQQSLIEAEKFWKQQLQGFQAPTQLLVGTKSEVETKSYNTQKIRLSQDCTSALQDLAQENELTLNTLLQGAWALLLSRYSGQEDIVFGATRACRRSALKDMDSMVGLFINTLPVRVQVDFDQPLLPWLKELSAQWISLSDYEHTPLVKIQEWSQVPKGLSLFESLFVFEDYEFNTALRSEGKNWESREFELLEQPNYPLTLTVYTPSELILKIDYDSSRFDAATIGRILGHLETLLNGFIANPQQCLGKLPLLTAAEKHQLLVEWNDTQADYPQDKCIHQLFEEQVERTPNNVAVVFEDEQLTYRELNARANQLAHYLQKLGVEPEVLVGICVERSLEMVVGLLGILKAGGAYVPLDPKYPKERLAITLEDAQVSVLLTQQTLVHQFTEGEVEILCLDSEWEAIAQKRQENPVNEVTAKNLAYVIYTSGSTGKPKGVQICHRSVVNLLETTRSLFSFNEQDVWTVFHSYAFDFSVWEIWEPIVCGGRIVILPLWITQSPKAFYDLLCKERVTVLNQTPSALSQLIYAKEAADTTRNFGVRLIICGGEAFPQALAQKLCEWRVPVWNFYGPTESTVWTAINKVKAIGTKGGSIPIGRPLCNIQLYVLEQHLQPVPIGIYGELYIGGDGLARGYLNRPELTSEKFIANPFSDEPGSRLYKTGDLARYLPDGNIEFLGRIDNQLKIRGFRIELGEIEAKLSQHYTVRQCVVTVREDIPNNQWLVAYIVLYPEKLLNPNELRRFLKQELPDYMIPSAFVVLETLPLTPNRKIDIRALPAPDTSRPNLEEIFIAPRTPTEQQIADIWTQVLGIEKISINENFFFLGGHSLLAARIIAQIQNVFQVDISVNTFFQNFTVASLSLVVTQKQEEKKTNGINRSTRINQVNAEQILAQLDKLSDEEVDSLLDEMLYYVG